MSTYRIQAQKPRNRFFFFSLPSFIDAVTEAVDPVNDGCGDGRVSLPRSSREEGKEVGGGLCGVGASRVKYFSS